ncbi:hypothetical protein B2J93_814 [Marssonina coronariae]|uniref:WSC domain-containing protein n=1 Tax=Diplocarpon coronariae TaxID=2795749 RepID=A0A218ZFX3_9HELO|nr:hypothetical protein B2J93_814 [Marssonina coronariae]
MLNVKSLTIASAAVTLFSGVNAALYPLKRNDQPAQPSCTEFTPFKYAGCFVDRKQYQYAGLEYGEECFCGASVNNIQADESDCNQPCTGDSSEICGAFDRISIYQDPTFPVADYTTISDYQQLGCHSEGSNGRSLAWRQDQVDSTTLTVETCLRACKAGGWSFAGLEYASECYCGVALGIGTLPIDDSTCNMPCNGDATETCGGRNALDLYVAKDLESSEPCEGGSSSPLSSLPAAISSLSSSSSKMPIFLTYGGSQPLTTTSGSIKSSSSSSLSSSSRSWQFRAFINSLEQSTVDLFCPFFFSFFSFPLIVTIFFYPSLDLVQLIYSRIGDPLDFLYSAFVNLHI